MHCGPGRCLLQVRLGDGFEGLGRAWRRAWAGLKHNPEAGAKTQRLTNTKQTRMIHAPHPIMGQPTLAKPPNSKLPDASFPESRHCPLSPALTRMV